MVIPVKSVKAKLPFALNRTWTDIVVCVFAVRLSTTLPFLSCVTHRPLWPSGLDVRLEVGKSGVQSAAGSHLRAENWQSGSFPAKTSGIIGTVLGPVGLVSVYCDGVGRSFCL